MIYIPNFIRIRQWESVQIREGGGGRRDLKKYISFQILEKDLEERGGEFRKKENVNGSNVFQTESTQKISSKLDNDKVFKIRGEIFEMKGGEIKNKMQMSQMRSQNKSM